MHITQESDYAIRIIYCLAKNQKRMDARSISQEMSVSLRFSLKILGKLVASGLVASFKGNRGGGGTLSAFPLPGGMRRVQPGSLRHLRLSAGLPAHQRAGEPGTGGGGLRPDRGQRGAVPLRIIKNITPARAYHVRAGVFEKSEKMA